MSNESALMRSIADQLGDIIQLIKKEIEPNRVTIPKSWQKGGRYCNSYNSGSNQPHMSRPLPEAIQAKVDEATRAPQEFRSGRDLTGPAQIGWNTPVFYEWWDECFWPIALIRNRALRYIEEMKA